MSAPTSSRPTAIRGPALTFTGDPFRDGLDKTMVHEPDAIVAMADGRITHFGPASRVVLIATEGVTDPDAYARVVPAGLGEAPSPSPAGRRTR